MATPRKTQIEKVEGALIRHNATPGITAKRIASIARIPQHAVSKIVCTLGDTYTIYKNWRKVDGKRTAFYRLAD